MTGAVEDLAPRSFAATVGSKGMPSEEMGAAAVGPIIFWVKLVKGRTVRW
jgi:hypothetical protein